MTIIIDPTDLRLNTKFLLKRLLMSAKDVYLKPGLHKVKRSFFHNDVINIHLTHGLVIGSSKHNPSFGRIEVLEGNIGSGAYGKTYNSLGVIHTEKNMSFKVRERKKEIIAKFIDLADSKPSSVNSEEWKINECSDQIHCKPALFNRDYGILRMTKAQGIPLSELIEDIHDGKIRMSLMSMLQLTNHLLKAVHNLHKKGWIHRDIKPNNILVDTTTLEVTLVDFGFTRKKGVANHIKGNWYYVAPEYTHTYVVTRKIDWFSLGKTLAELWGDRSIYSFASEELTTEQAGSFHTCESFIDLFHCLNIPSDIRNELTWILQDLVRYNPDYRSGYKDAHRAINALIEKIEAPEFDPKIAHGNCVIQTASNQNSEEDSSDITETNDESCTEINPDDYEPILDCSPRISVI